MQSRCDLLQLPFQFALRFRLLQIPSHSTSFQIVFHKGKKESFIFPIIHYICIEKSEQIMADNYLERKFEEMEKRKKSASKYGRYGRMRASSLHTFKPLQNKEEKKDEEK